MKCRRQWGSCLEIQTFCNKSIFNWLSMGRHTPQVAARPLSFKNQTHLMFSLTIGIFIQQHGSIIVLTSLIGYGVELTHLSTHKLALHCRLLKCRENSSNNFTQTCQITISPISPIISCVPQRGHVLCVANVVFLANLLIRLVLNICFLITFFISSKCTK